MYGGTLVLAAAVSLIDFDGGMGDSYALEAIAGTSFKGLKCMAGKCQLCVCMTGLCIECNESDS